MKLRPRVAWQLGSLACVLSLHVGNLNAQPTILAGPVTNTANGHIYYLLPPTNWIGSWFNAGRLGGRLVTINDAAENTWVFNTFANYGGVARNLWLGLKDSAQEGTRVWDSGDPSIYRNWAPGEPDNGGAGGNEDYVVMRGPALSSPGTWSDVSGDQTNAPVVEKIPPAPPATGPFNVAADFSTNQNPNGVWSYGYSTTLGGPMTLHAERGNLTGLDFWRTDIWLGVPAVSFNPANQTVTNSTGTVVLGPHQLSFHPGPNGEFCLIRFTAPTNDQYQVSGAFTGVDTNGTTTDVHITLSNVQPADAGTYSVRVSNAVGVAISSNATLTVFTPGTNCAARPSGLVAWWRAEGNANDSAGTNHGTTFWSTWYPCPMPAYTAGQVGQAFDINRDQVVLVPASSDFLLTNSFAVEGWIYAREPNNFPNKGIIFNLLGNSGVISLSVWPSLGNVAFEIQGAGLPTRCKHNASDWRDGGQHIPHSSLHEFARLAGRGEQRGGRQWRL